MRMHDGSTFDEFSSRYESQNSSLREDKLKALLIRFRDIFKDGQAIVGLCTKLELQEELQRVLDKSASLE